MKILIVGSGGREHCLAWKLAQSPRVDKIYCAPGNAGTSLIAQNMDVAADDIGGLLNLAREEGIGLTVVGPEAPLVEGIVDEFEREGLKIFGPQKEFARLEGSKIFAKEVMRKNSIPTANFETFDNPDEAKRYVKNEGAPLVVKADGLAAGKGVVVCKTEQEAFSAINMMMVEKKFHRAGEKVVIEDCLEGEEVSILVFTDGNTVLPLVPSQDHKQIFDGDNGPNTGGMGAYAPVELVSNEMLQKVVSTVFQPLIEGLKEEGRAYKGILYAGLMINDDQPYVLEFNVRFGDPETQAILPKLKSDLAEIMVKTIDGRLDQVKLVWDERFCLCVVLASGGYPGSYEKGKEINGLEKLQDLEDIFVFHAGSKLVRGPQSTVHNFLTAGGRVLGVVGLGRGIKDTRDKVYKAIENIYFENMHYRRDIGNRVTA